MEDWDEALFDRDYEAPTEESELGAIPAADVAAATPLTRAMLDICSRDMELPFSGSPKAIARLLDIAILTGNQKAAFNLSQKCQLRPLRRWAFQWYRFRSEVFWKAARAALWAGADFQDLIVQYNEDVPFPQALFLKSELEDWQKIRHLLPRGHDLWRPKNLDNRLGKFFLKGPQRPRGSLQLSLDKIRAAEDAGVDVQCCLNWIFDVFEDEDDDGDIAAVVTLLDVAIWCGQPDCAEAVVDAGIELKGDDMTLAWHKRVLRGEGVRMAFPHPRNYILDVVPSEAEIAAGAASRAWLKRLWKSESSQKGIVLYQMMLKMFNGISFSTDLVQEILFFSMPVPKIIDQLDLWEHVGDWMATICGRPASAHAVPDCNTATVEEGEGEEDNGEAGALLYIEVRAFFSIVWIASD